MFTAAEYFQAAEEAAAQGDMASATAYAALASVPTHVVTEVREAEASRERWHIRRHRANLRQLRAEG